MGITVVVDEEPTDKGRVEIEELDERITDDEMPEVESRLESAEEAALAEKESAAEGAEQMDEDVSEEPAKEAVEKEEKEFEKAEDETADVETGAEGRETLRFVLLVTTRTHSRISLLGASGNFSSNIALYRWGSSFVSDERGMTDRK